MCTFKGYVVPYFASCVASCLFPFWDHKLHPELHEPCWLTRRNYITNALFVLIWLCFNTYEKYIHVHHLNYLLYSSNMCSYLRSASRGAWPVSWNKSYHLCPVWVMVASNHATVGLRDAGVYILVIGVFLGPWPKSKLKNQNQKHTRGGVILGPGKGIFWAPLPKKGIFWAPKSQKGYFLGP